VRRQEGKKVRKEEDKKRGLLSVAPQERSRAEKLRA